MPDRNEKKLNAGFNEFNFPSPEPVEGWRGDRGLRSTKSPTSISWQYKYDPPSESDVFIVVNLNMPDYHLDRSAFKAQTFEEASNHSAYYRKLSWQERLEIAGELNSVAFNYLLGDPPKMDRTLFKARSRNA